MTSHRSVTMRIPARVESIRPLTALVKKLASEAHLDERAAFHCQLALDEAFANIIEHAYADQPTGEIEVAIYTDMGICMIYITDFGEPYDPSQVSSSPLDSSLEEAEPGGLGLYLMRSVMDEIHYTPGANGNRLVMIKRSPTTKVL